MKAILRSVFLALTIMVAQTVPADAGPFEDGEAAYDRGDYVTALQHLRPLAGQGHAEAQYFLGVMYNYGTRFLALQRQRHAGQLGKDNDGDGVPQDYAEANIFHMLRGRPVRPGFLSHLRSLDGLR